MAIKKEEFQALIEREGVMDFIWSRSWSDIEGTEIGLYELANDRWGVIFQIFPPFYAMQATEKKLNTFFRLNLPEKSSIQFFMFTSRNLEKFKKGYENIHKQPGQVQNPDVLNELADNKLEWIDKYRNESLFKNKGMDFRLRNYVNLCVVTIPKKNKQGNDISRSEVINIFSRVFTGLADFAPKKFTQAEYVALMREILVPDAEIWNVEEDHRTYLNTQVVDNDSTMVLEDDGTIGIGKLIPKKEFLKLQREDLNEEHDEEEEYEEEEKGLLDALKNLFSKKEEIEEEREAFTKWHAKAYTTKLYPAYMNLFTLLNNFVDFYGTQIETEIPCSYFSSLTIFIEDREKIKKEVLEKTQWNLWQTKSLGDSARFFPEIVDRAREAEAINLMLNKGEMPMSAMWSLVLMDDSNVNVQKYGERIKKKFMEKNWVLQEETVIPHWVFLYSLPLQFEESILVKHSKRMNTLFSQNCASITPLMTGEKGFGQPVLVYVDRAGQLAGVDIFASETNYNFIVVGSSGSGKSYTMADFFTNYLMTGAKIRVIDVGRSYKHLCSLIGGQYIEFTEEANICLNFFTHVELNENQQIHEDEMQTIIPLIGLMAMQSLDPEDASSIEVPVIAGYISQAVTMAFEARHRNAGMQDVLLALEKILAEQKNNTGETDRLLHSLITALYPFGNPKGEYYKYFNGINNLKFESDFVVLELEEIDSNALLKSVVLAAIAHMINTEFFLGSREQRKILAIDEAWSIMDNKIVIRFLETMARRIRKYNGASGIITQTIGDFYKNKATRAIFDSSATKIFLKQSAESINAAEQKGELNLDKGVINLMQTVSSKPPMFSELMIKQDNGAFFISRLITDKLAHWIYTNHPKDMQVIFNIMREFNISELDAKIIKGYSDKNKTTLEEEFNKRLKAGLLNIGATNNEELTVDDSLEEDLDKL